jgi:hypothetical protein
MSRFTDNLWRDIVREHGATLVYAEPEPRRSRFSRLRGLRRPRVLAGSSLGLASVGAALTLILSGTAETAPAFAVTTAGDGTVMVTMDYNANQNLPQVNAKLIALGTHEQIEIFMAPGPAPTPGSVTCTPRFGDTGPTIKVMVGDEGTEEIHPGESAGNTAEGTYHMIACDSFIAWNNAENTGIAAG